MRAARLSLVSLLVLGLAGCPETPPPAPPPPAGGSVPAAPPATAKADGPVPSSEPIQTTPSGLKYQELKAGTGEAAVAGKRTIVHYHGWLVDGTTFDASRKAGRPFEFTLGRGEVIKAWDEGVLGMKVGGARRLIAPPELAYGARGFPPLIPPGATLTFDVELLGQR